MPPAFAARLAAGCGAALVACAAPAAVPWTLEGHTDRHSDFSTLPNLDSGKYRTFEPRAGRNLAYVDDEVRIGTSKDAWSFALLARNRATLVTTRSSIQALQHSGGVGRTVADQAWAIDARLRGFRGFGLEAGRDFGSDRSGWGGGFTVQALAHNAVRDQRVEGQAAYTAATATYAFDLQSSQVSDRLGFPFRTGYPHNGFGLLLGGHAAWRSDAWSANLSVRDVGMLRWRQLPGQAFTLSSNTSAIDANDFVVYRPLLTGRNSQDTRTVAAPVSATAQADWHVTSRDSVRIAADHVAGFGALPSVAWLGTVQGWKLQAGWRLHERRLELGAASGPFQVQLGFDPATAGRHSRLFAVTYNGSF